MLNRTYSGGAAMGLDEHASFAHPEVLSAPQVTATSSTDHASAFAAMHTVSYAEYQRVRANEAALGENMETLKALVLQLAGQLHQANEALQLLERCSARPLSTRTENHTSNATKSTAAGSAPAALPVPLNTERRAQQDLLERKDAVIEALRQQLRDQERDSIATLQEVAREKNAMIERLALDLDDARCALRRRR